MDSSIMPGDSLCAGELADAMRGVPGSSITSSDASSLRVLRALEIICSSIDTYKNNHEFELLEKN